MFFNRKNKTNDMFNDLRFSNPDFTNQYPNSFTPNNMYNNFNNIYGKNAQKNTIWK